MKQIKCVLADDEALSRELLENYIGRVDYLQLLMSCKNGMEVFNVLKTQAVDLVFLDIQMPQLTGLELLKALHKSPAVVFTTAYREYAIEGYEWNVLDYLLKPISFERFLKSIDKYVNSWKNAEVPFKAIDGSSSSIYRDFIHIKSGKKTVKAFLDQILYIEGMKDFVKIMTTGGEILTYQSLAELERRLPNNQFLRIHRSFIVSLHKVKSFTASTVDIAGKELPIGNFYQREVLKLLNAE